MSTRIACGAGFWGDYPDATAQLLEHGEFDYLQFEYLAEVTMGLLHRLKSRDPNKGYATDFIDWVIEDHLAAILEKEIRVVTNAGGLNPAGCAEKVLEIAAQQNVDVDVAIVTGDEITTELQSLHSSGVSLDHIDTDQAYSQINEQVVAGVTYLGAFPIARALNTGADVVITGRTVDPALTLGPLIHEYNWTQADYDQLAAGIIAGHLIECGTQVTGGNLSKGWEQLDFANIGYPIADVNEQGTVHITKPSQTGGEVSEATVSEQLVYEIGDPTAYLTPDVSADFTSPDVNQIDNNLVALEGIEGSSPPNTYKVSIHYKDGYKLAGNLLYSRPDALAKARKAADILQNRIDTLELEIPETTAEFVGHNATHGPLAPKQENYNEIMLRFAAWSENKADLRRFGMEFAPLSLAGPPSVAGLTDTGRPTPQKVINAWPALIPKTAVEPEVITYE